MFELNPPGGSNLGPATATSIISPINSSVMHGNIKHIEAKQDLLSKTQPQPLSPSKSMKAISQPYQGKTMASVNKFTEDPARAGCKSVMQKHKYTNLDHVSMTAKNSIQP